MGRRRFEEAYEEYADKIYRFIYYKTYSRETAEDICSQTFLKALEKWDSFDPMKGAVSSWLYAIAGNLVIDHFRKKKPSANVDDIWDLAGDEDILTDAERAEQLEEVRKCLSKLEKAQRDLIILRIWQELSFKEIGEIVGKSEAGCKMQFYRILNKLKTELSLSILVLYLLLDHFRGNYG